MHYQKQTHTTFCKPEREMRVVITYKNMPASHAVSHIGLGVSALNTAKSLKQNGIPADVWSIMNAKDLAQQLSKADPMPTHVVIAAPWIPALDLQAFLVFRFPQVKFAVVCHSNVGFLSADPQAIINFRDDLNLEQGSLNFVAAGNSQRFCHFIKDAYQRPCTWLPNLYFMEGTIPTPRRPWSGGTLRVGSFGAVRPLKNTISAAAATLELSEMLNTNIDFHVSVGRIEGGYTVVRALEAMLNGHPRVKLVKDEWNHWPTFRHIVRHMHVMIQASHTETFNMVTADGCAESVPSVVSDAIDWAPRDWKAEVDDPRDIARIARRMISDPMAGMEGFEALLQHNIDGFKAWENWINS